MGLLLVALAVQFFINGLTDLGLIANLPKPMDLPLWVEVCALSTLRVVSRL
jgi:hypothetical protein